MVDLVLLLDAAQDRDGVLDRRLGHEHRLEATGERGVLLHMLAVFVERGGAHAVQLAARERGFQQVRGVHRAVALARAHERVHLVDEQHDLAVRGGHLVQHGLQTLLELAAILRAGDQGAHVEAEELLVLQALGHVAVDDAHGQALGDGGLADAGLADQHGVVLGPTAQHLDAAADLLVAADDRVDLALAGGLGQVAGVFLERLEAVLGRGAVGRAALARVLDGLVEGLGRDAAIAQRLGGVGLLDRERSQQPLDGDETVGGLLGQLLGLVDHLGEGLVEIDLPALHLGQLGDGEVVGRAHRLRVAAGPRWSSSSRALSRWSGVSRW